MDLITKIVSHPTTIITSGLTIGGCLYYYFEDYKETRKYCYAFKLAFISSMFMIFSGVFYRTLCVPLIIKKQMVFY